MGRASGVFSTLPHSLPPSAYPAALVGVAFLEGGSGSRAAVSPFPRLNSVPSGLCSAAREGGGAGVQNAQGEGVELGGAREAGVCPGLLGSRGGQEELGNLALLSPCQPRQWEQGAAPTRARIPGSSRCWE